MHIIDEAINVAIERSRLIIETGKYQQYAADSWPFYQVNMTIFEACSIFFQFLEAKPCHLR